MLKQVERLAREAADIMKSHQQAAVHEKEGHFNFVTDADLAVQDHLAQGLLALLPGSLLLAEEQENQPLSQAPTWIVDPIDGTVNYMRGRRCSAISIALVTQGQAELALIYDPYADEMFTALRGRGCLLNGEPVQVSDRPFDKALVTFGTSPYQPELARLGMLAAYHALLEAGDLRRSGSASLDLAWVACGRTDAYFEMRLSPWDYAAGVLLVREAGGLVSQPFYDDFDHGRAAATLAAGPNSFERPLQLMLDAKAGRLSL